jgi:plastocyanin
MRSYVRLFLIFAVPVFASITAGQKPTTGPNSRHVRTDSVFCAGVVPATNDGSRLSAIRNLLSLDKRVAIKQPWESIFTAYAGRAFVSGSAHSDKSNALILGLPESGAPPPAGASLTLAQTVDVTVFSNFFSPQMVRVTAGDTVRWSWSGSPHTVTSGACCVPNGVFCSPSDSQCDSSAISGGGAVYSHTFNSQGTFSYFCRVHGSLMTGSVVVDAAPARGVTKTGVFRPSTGELFLKNSNSSGFADTLIIFGNPGDYPLAGDWNGDGIDTVGIYRDGVFYLRNTNTTGFADIVVPFGSPGDQPIAGDWNGDGVDTIGIYRNGTFYLRNSNTAGAPDLVFTLGDPGDVGIAGDWNGDGITTCGVFRPSNGIIYLKNSNTTGFADLSFVYGNAGDKPVAGDWNGDGIDTVGIYRSGVFFLSNSNATGFADTSFVLGNSGDFPIAGNWNGSP